MLASIRQFLASLRARLGAQRLILTTDSVSYRWPLRPRRTIRFCDLAEVRIKTTDEGPMFEDVFWVLIASTPEGSTSTVTIPAEFDAAKTLRDRLMDLPGFDHELMMEAMGCVEHREFVCWVRGTRPCGRVV